MRTISQTNTNKMIKVST